ncbi:MAG: hypothetical protein AAF399_00130 [Bacteroidota bacterium]
MESQVKPLFSGMGRRELIRICNEKMVCAARDLAEFTKNGINASFIVALAHKCDSFEDRLDQEQQLAGNQDIEWEIKDALKHICELGQQIWSSNPIKSKDYLLPAAQRSPVDKRSPRVAS